MIHQALASRGARGARCNLTPLQLAELEAVLEAGPTAWGWEDQCWTLARIGELVDYLRHGRPPSSDRYVFYRVVAPVRPGSRIAISACAQHYLLKAGIQVPRAGSHTLPRRADARAAGGPAAAGSPARRIPFLFGPAQSRRLPDSLRAPGRGPAYHAIFALCYGSGCALARPVACAWATSTPNARCWSCAAASSASIA